MDKLFPPRSARNTRRSSSDLKTSQVSTTFREKKLRKLSQETLPDLMLDTGYIYKPQSHLPVTDTEEITLQLSLLRKNFDRHCTE